VGYALTTATGCRRTGEQLRKELGESGKFQVLDNLAGECCGASEQTLQGLRRL